MICSDRETELGALIDGELPPEAAHALIAHLATCPGCAAGLGELLALRTELAALAPEAVAPDALRRRVAALTEPAIARPVAAPSPAPPPVPRRRRPMMTGLALAGLGIAAALALMVAIGRHGNAETATFRALVVASRRAALPLPPAAVPRSAAAAWLARAGLSVPPVPTLRAAGFRFVGVRADLVAGHRAAVLSYAQGGAVFRVFAWPSGAGEPAHPPRLAHADGRHILYWNDGRTEFWAVGRDPAALAALVAAYRRV